MVTNPKYTTMIKVIEIDALTRHYSLLSLDRHFFIHFFYLFPLVALFICVVPLPERGFCIELKEVLKFYQRANSVRAEGVKNYEQK